MLMWGVGKDEMKGKHVLPTTIYDNCDCKLCIYIYTYTTCSRIRIISKSVSIPLDASSSTDESDLWMVFFSWKFRGFAPEEEPIPVELEDVCNDCCSDATTADSIGLVSS